MATVNKDFRVKHGLVVQGTTGTINSSNILTEASTEFLQDTAAAVLTGGAHTGITFEYNDTSGVVNATVSAEPVFGQSITFEGATANDFETTLQVTEPTADRTVTFPDASGTVAFTSDIPTTESIQDIVGGMVSSNTESNITVEYDDANGKLNFSVPTLDTEAVQDIVGAMVSSNTEDGISVTYDDDNGKLNFNVNDPTITIAGDVDGNATMTNLGNTTINVTLDTVNTAVGTYGTSTAIPSITVDGKGRVTNVTTNSISTTLGIAGDTGTDNVTLGTDTLTFEGGTGITSTVSDNKVKVDIDNTVATLSDQQTLTNKVLGTNVDLGANLDAATYRIVNLGAPDQATDAATKAYVDAAVEGLHVHEAARVAVQGNISIATGLENGDTAGGVTLATGNRVLLKDQTNAAENGIYVVQASGQALRAADFDTAAEIDSGDFVFVSEGTYANTGWVQTLKPATIGTDPLQFTQFSGAGTFTAGVGLDLNGTEFVLDLTEVDTSTLPEGTTNLYYTNERVDDRVDGLLVGGTGISKTYDDNANSLTLAVDFTEFNTNNITEGTTNLYFTNARAVTALEAVVPDFTAVEVNSIAKQVAATTTSLGSVVATAYSFPKATYRTAKFIVKIDNATHNEVTEVLLSLDSSDNIAMTEYAIVSTDGSRGTITADISGADVRLRVDPVNDSTISVVGTLLA